MIPLLQHQLEIEANQASWEKKPVLRDIYDAFYQRILSLIDPQRPGKIVEIGSGIGNLKHHIPNAVRTDLFPNPWLDLVCDGYDLPFADGSLSHLVLFDVFHHLEAPRAFLHEAHRVLGPKGRLIMFEPYMSLASLPVYGLAHHEPVAWRQPINPTDTLPRPRPYYAAQGNATRLFFNQDSASILAGWDLFHHEAISAFSYLLSGGYSKPSLLPQRFLPRMIGLDSFLSRWPRVFASRCLIGMEPAPSATEQA